MEKKSKKSIREMLNREELQKEFEAKTSSIRQGVRDLSDDLRNLLRDEIEAYRKKEKHRAIEMLGIFAAHNYYANGITPEELRTTLEDLGPTYVKIGQVMSSRADILPEEYCDELKKLRQTVKQLDPQVARAVIEQETGKRIDEIYKEFRDEPLGSASIAQAHYGVLLDGTRVVTKVQRPLIADMMFKDFALLRKLASVVNAASEVSGKQPLDMVAVIGEMEKVTRDELDFRVEAENTRFFKENCIENEDVISCPSVIDALTTERIFTMTFVDGCSLAKKEKLADQGCDLDAIGRVIVENYIHQILDVGVFHADPHQGNIMVSRGKPYWIDFGMIGRLTASDINCIQSMVMSYLENDAESIVDTIMLLGASSPQTNREKLVRDASALINKYHSATSVSDIEMSTLFEEIMDLASKNGITLPGRLTMLARSIITIEGIIEELCPELNLLEIVSTKLMERIRYSIDIKQKLKEKIKDIWTTGKKAAKIPALAADALGNIAKGKVKMNMELTGYDDALEKIGRYVRYVVLAVFACVQFIGSCILCMTDFQPKLPNGMPLIAVTGIVFSIALAIFSVKKLWKK